jgi:nucleoside 2-deoxyribosyltransferase
MKRIYFSVSYIYRDEYLEIYKKLKILLKEKYNIELYAFVFEYLGNIEDHTLMKVAFSEMDKSDMIIAEVSHKSIGVGVETGYLKAKGKKVIYLHKNGVEIENIINGISDYVVDYSNPEDIISWFDANILKI